MWIIKRSLKTLLGRQSLILWKWKPPTNKHESQNWGIMISIPRVCSKWQSTCCEKTICSAGGQEPQCTLLWAHLIKHILWWKFNMKMVMYNQHFMRLMTFANHLQMKRKFFFSSPHLLSIWFISFNVKQENIACSTSNYWPCSFVFQWLISLRRQINLKMCTLSVIWRREKSVLFIFNKVFLGLNPYNVPVFCVRFSFSPHSISHETVNRVDLKLCTLIVNVCLVKYGLMWGCWQYD